MKTHLLTLILLLGIATTASSQDLGNLKNQKPVELSGSINLSLNGYSTTRQRPFRDPFLWTLSGSPTLSLYGVTLPFSFVISRKQEDFRQPFNQFGLSPYYKWVKLHLGYRSLSFSQYTLNGHIFNGAGIELTPGNWRLGGMYGRLLEPVATDAGEGVPLQPTYLRNGYAAKVGYGTSSNFVDLVLFKGWDDPASIDRPIDSAAVNPQENLVLGLKTRQTLFKNLVFDADVGLSGWTSNLFARGLAPEDVPLNGLTSGLFTVNYSTQFLKAINASLGYRLKLLSIKVQYRRIDPEFKTMGAYFFNNDLENITVQPSWSMFKRRVRVAASIGWQRNNLFDTKANQTNRRINALQLSYTPSGKFSFSSSFTNFQISQQQIDLVRRDVIDSLELEQFTNNLSLHANYNFGTKTRKYVVSASYSQQSIDQEQQNEVLGDNDSRSVSPSLSFRYTNKDSGWGYKANASYNDFQNSSVSSERLGFTAGLDKAFNEKITLNASAAYFNTKLDGQAGGNTLRYGIRGIFKAGDHHLLSFTTNYVRRSSANERVERFSEYLGNISYTFTF